MKIRTGFVSNSSSASFILTFDRDLEDDLLLELSELISYTEIRERCELCIDVASNDKISQLAQSILNALDKYDRETTIQRMRDYLNLNWVWRYEDGGRLVYRNECVIHNSSADVSHLIQSMIFVLTYLGKKFNFYIDNEE